MENPLLDYENNIDYPSNNFKILFVGADKVGKSSIISHICEDKNKNPPATLGVDQRVKYFDESSTCIKLIELGNGIDMNINRTVVIDYFTLAHAIIYVVDAGDTMSLWKANELAKFSSNQGRLQFLLLNKVDRHDCVLTYNSKWVEDFAKKNDIHSIYSTTLNVPKTIEIFTKEILTELKRFYMDKMELCDYLNLINENELSLNYSSRKSRKRWSCC